MQQQRNRKATATKILSTTRSVGFCGHADGCLAQSWGRLRRATNLYRSPRYTDRTHSTG
ncbi:hypothetical protein GCM10009536_48800 [Streptomyces thermocarboxydus]|jgi:hypothetical protein